MAKRFTDTKKWQKPSFRKASWKMKLAWIYLVDNCDHAGIWDVDMDLLSYYVGSEISLDELLESFEKLTILGDKLFVE